MYPEKHPEVVGMLKEFQERWRKNLKPAVRGVSETTRQRLQTLFQRWREVLAK
ncbi:MAG: hypothetical protein DFNUSKGM_002246 [Candidatus Fervidibacter sacchari]